MSIDDTEHSRPDMIWYLAYGANMSKEVLTGRRRVKPARSVPVVAPGYYLSFDHPGMPYTEPGFASIRALPNSSGDKSEKRFFPITRNKCSDAPVVHGVAHWITLKEFNQVQLSEGGGGSTEFGYQDAVVKCESYTGEKILAHTLMTHEHCTRPCLPSNRYLSILQVGAKEHEINPEYQRYLNDLLPFEAHTWSQKFGKYIFFLMLIPIFGPVLISKVFRKKEEMPLIFHWWLHFLSHLIWALHDQISEPLLGNGGSSKVLFKSRTS